MVIIKSYHKESVIWNTFRGNERRKVLQKKEANFCHVATKVIYKSLMLSLLLLLNVNVKVFTETYKYDENFTWVVY